MAEKLNKLTPGGGPQLESSSPWPPAVEQGATVPSSIVPKVVELDDQNPFEELTQEEERDRLLLERKVERAFYQAGKALKELRDRRLYRSTHPNFESYCWERFGFRRRHPYRLIDAATVFDNLIEMCPDRTQNENLIDVSEEMCPNWTQILPTTEYQVRPLTKLEPNEQVEAWQQAVEQNNGKVPSAKIVKEAVQRIRERHPVPHPWRVGDVCSIMVKENPDLRGYGGCWAIVSEVHHFSCTVHPSKSPLKGETNGLPPFRGELGGWDGFHQVRLENLKDREYLPEQRTKMRELGDRLSKLPLEGRSKPVRDFLAGLGQLDRPWLTALEETILQAIEKEGSS